MPFTEDEKRLWLEEKRTREACPRTTPRPPTVGVCVNCQLPFGVNEGVVTDEVALCDICAGD